MKKNWLEYEVYDRVISLGGSCQTAYQLKRLGLRQDSFPFDWLFTTDIEIIINAINTGFVDWLLRENLVEQVTDTAHRRIVDTKNGAIHQHIFPLDKSWEESYDEVKAIVDRRIARLLSLRGKRLLFVRVNVEMEKIKELEASLVNWFGENIRLMVLLHSREFEIQKIDMSLKYTDVYEIYHESEGEFAGWTGYDYHWNLLFQNIRLKEMRMNLLDSNKMINFFDYEKEASGLIFRWTRDRSTIDFREFMGGTGKITLTSPFGVKVFVLDALGNMVDVIKIRKNAEYLFDITYETRFLTLKPENIWSPKEKYGTNDDRTLGVRVEEIKIYR